MNAYLFGKIEGTVGRTNFPDSDFPLFSIISVSQLMSNTNVKHLRDVQIYVSRKMSKTYVKHLSQTLFHV